MEVDYQRRPQRRRLSFIKWTLEHHKQVVDTAVRLGLADLKVETAKARILIVELMSSAAMKGVSRDTILLHMSNFQRLQEKTMHDLLSLSSERSLTRDFERLNIQNNNCKKDLSWSKLEHHKRFVEAVIQLGGLGKALPIGILRLMEEESRRGLTQQTIFKNLLRLRRLQRKTQESVIDLYKSKTSMLRSKRERIEAFHGGKCTTMCPSLLSHD